jgi:hypothetical protein
MLTNLTSILLLLTFGMSTNYLCMSPPDEFSDAFRASARPGQGANSVTIDRTGFDGASRSVTTIHGLDLSCGRTGSRTISARQRVDNRKFDEYGNIKFNDEKARLDNYAIQLQNEPTAQGYIYGYGSCGTEGLTRANRAKDYLVNTRGIDASRIYVVDGGCRSELKVELWIGTSGGMPPTAETSGAVSPCPDCKRPYRRPRIRGGEDPPPPAEGPDSRPRRSPRPRSGMRATGGMESPANTNADVSTSPATTSNTNGSFSSQLRGPANVGFQVPESMRMDETKSIELVVSPTESAESLVQGLEEEGRKETATTRYSDRMEAKLVGTGFTITPAGPDIQPVEPGQVTRWRWQIQPKAGGTQRLDLTLNAIVNDGKDRKLITALKREININVTWGQRASTFLGALKEVHWIWGALVVPIAGAIYAWWRKRGSKPRKKRTPKRKG